MNRCTKVHTAYGVTRECRRTPDDRIHAFPEVGCAWPDTHHRYTEEPMPEPRVTTATVHDAHKGFRRGIPGNPDGYYGRVVLDWPEEAPAPRIGDRVAVAGSVDAIFEWMESLPAARVLEAAKAWAAMVDTMPSIIRPPRMEARAQALYDAVKALGEAPSEAYEPPVIRDKPPVKRGFDAGRKPDRTATVITITIEEGA